MQCNLHLVPSFLQSLVNPTLVSYHNRTGWLFQFTFSLGHVVFKFDIEKIVRYIAQAISLTTFLYAFSLSYNNATDFITYCYLQSSIYMNSHS